MQDKQEDHSSFIDVYKPICGWKAIKYSWYDDDLLGGGMWDVEQTGMMGYPDKRSAIIEALDWAEAEELRYVGPALEPMPDINVVFLNGEYFIHTENKGSKCRLINKVCKTTWVQVPSCLWPSIKKLKAKSVLDKWYFYSKQGVHCYPTGKLSTNPKVIQRFKEELTNDNIDAL